jgi:hypothetical protein
MVADEHAPNDKTLFNFINKFRLTKHGMPPHRKPVGRYLQAEVSLISSKT